MQNGKIIEWHDNPHGFVYDTTEQRLLKSSASGFAAADSKKVEANAGLIDWTDGVNQITWVGHQRYLPPVFDNRVIVFKNNHKFDFSSIIGGYICGAAFKNSVFILFVKTPLMGLMAFFVNGSTIIDSFTIGDYHSILQAVCISPDCTKAAFIAVPQGQLGNETVIVELTINLSGHSVVIIDTTVQDIHDPVDYTNSVAETPVTWIKEIPIIVLSQLYPTGGDGYTPVNVIDYGVLFSAPYGTQHVGSTVRDTVYSYARTSFSIKVAVDYDVNNTKKTFFIDSYFSHNEKWRTGITQSEYDYYEAHRYAGVNNAYYAEDGSLLYVEASGWLDAAGNYLPFPSSELRAVEYTTAATISYNGLVRNINIISETTLDNAGHWYKNYNFLMIDTLDLRYGVMAFTDVNEYEHWKNGVRYETTQLKKYSLYIGNYYHKIRDDSFTDTTGDRFNGYLFKTDEITISSNIVVLFSLPIFYDVFSLRIQFGFSSYHNPQVLNIDVPVAVIFNGVANIIRATALAITDRYSNKLITLANIESIISAINYQITFGYNTPIIIKIDNTNTLHDNTITNLKGII